LNVLPLQWYVAVVGEQKALEEGGELYGKTVYLFGSTERKCTSSQLLSEVTFTTIK
jgi:hypothetical protein